MTTTLGLTEAVPASRWAVMRIRSLLREAPVSERPHAEHTCTFVTVRSERCTRLLSTRVLPSCAILEPTRPIACGRGPAASASGGAAAVLRGMLVLTLLAPRVLSGQPA